jgi:replication fork protection complex subunit Tof1/Swi1
METTWTIPGSTTSESLQTNIQLIKQFIANPLAPNGKPASEMIKKKARKKRARKDLDDDESAARKRTRRTDTAPVYHTQQFVIDSDEDDDDAFFTNEAKLREKNVSIIACLFELLLILLIEHLCRWPHFCPILMEVAKNKLP